MKRLILTLTAVCLTCFTALAQNKKFFRIDYSITTEAPTTDSNREIYMKAWVNQDVFRITYTQEDSQIEVMDKKTGKSFLLFPDIEAYSTLYAGVDDEQIDYSQLPIAYIKGQEKTIAGYPCKLAVVNFGVEDVKWDIWYTEQIPKLYWSEFNFLQLLPGAPLSITSAGNGYVAQKVVMEELAKNLFQIPENYNLLASTMEEVLIQAFLYTNETGELYGLEDGQHHVLIAPKYSYIAPFNGDIAIVNNSDEKYGAINLAGKEVIALQYDFLSYDENTSKYLYGQNEKYGLLNADGTIYIKAGYDMVSYLKDGLFEFPKDGKSGLMDEKGHVIVPAIHESIFERNKDYFVTIENDSYYLYSVKNNKKLTDGYEYI
ncbi:WG repeat-containing protein [Sphingobacterium sp. SRCM116780]|uniref:WG repeat-containing protein n=1 Tax=Sphingobacterium sp. SRCM116780 TaxID=2907623 RepID=UPI001F1672EA|nr:WG repeat-containing protein [Sphingobacterium sp. SRCM116780]UIR57505.1 WG repeat-containing protein [Sphingobacterium sp. SRCM116780]